ncbi:MAG: SagB/ThcOx family dehydrogenase [Candidatus Omnitrophica bacterium]|nr:SagB/ThcOx family dehydrogenase [Candidatus Omnitrophota bacterium]
MNYKVINKVISIIILLTSSALSAERDMEKIKLPKPRLKGTLSLEETIQKRRSVRSYSSKELTIEEVSQLCWACQGITDKRGFRAAPSAGAIYPLEVYILNKDGIYHYVPKTHTLEKKSDKDVRVELARACLGQHFIQEAPFDMVICAVYERVSTRYGERAIRYTDIEVGHAAQNVHLEAIALGLDSVPVGAFQDEAVSEVLGLPKNEKPIYVIPVGHKR